MKILDVGCGHGRKHIKRGDIGIDRIKGLCDIQANAGDLPFAPACFEKVFLIHVLEHLTNFGQSLKEAKRVLISGGLIVIEVPNPSSFWIFKDYVFSRKAHFHEGVSKDHVCAFGESELFNLMREIGFNPTRITYVDSAITKRRLQENDLLRRIFYMVLFCLFPAFRNALRIYARKP